MWNQPQPMKPGYRARKMGHEGDRFVEGKWAFPCISGLCPDGHVREHRGEFERRGHCPVCGENLQDAETHWHYYGWDQ